MKKIILMMMALTYALLASDAILSIDTGGHTALIRDVIITKNGDIISASDDKSIRVWDSKSGKEKRKILGEIGAGLEGMIFAIALSPDEKFLAVGGFLDKPKHGESGNIRLYDYRSGKLLKLLKSHTNVVNDLAFSPDGRYLASGSADTTVKLWDMKSFTLNNTISFHTDAVYGVKFGKNSILSAGHDNRIAIHSFEGKFIKSYTHGENLAFIATNGEEIAVCGKGNEILIFDMALNLKSKIQSETVPMGLSYSPNGRYLIAGTEGNPNHNVNIYDSQKGYAKIATFDKHTNLTMAVAFLDNNTAISGGGNNQEIYIWDIKTQNIKTKIVGAGQMVWSVGCEGDSVAWGNVLNAKSNNNRGELQKSFNLKSLHFSNSASESNFNRINSDGLSHSKGGDYGYDAVLTIASSNTSITKDAYTGYRHNCYGWYRDFIISGGSNGQLKIYDTKGVEVASLVGHTGEIWSIALDGDRLVSGSDDQTMKVWDLKPLSKGVKTLYPTLSMFIGSDNEWVMWSKEGFFNASKDGAKYIGYHINQGADKEAEFIGVERLYDVFYRPDIVKAKLEGKDITKLVGDMTFQKALENPPPKISIGLDDSVSDKKEITIPYTVTSSGGGISEVRIFQNGKLVHGDGYYKNTLGYILTDAKEIGTEHKGINGDPSTVMSAVSKIAEEKSSPYKHSITIPLIAGEKNEISIMAFNKTNTVQSNPATVTITSTLPKEKGKLWVLGVGLDEYHEMEPMLNYAVKDVKDFVCLYAGYGKECTANGNAKSIFGDNIEVEAYLTDNNATKANILKALNSIAQKAQPQDTFVWFQSGHGILDADGNYHIVTFDTNLTKYKDTNTVKEMLNNTLNSNDILEVSKNIKAMSQLIVLDTCHAGGLDGKMGGLYDGRMSKLMKNMGVHLYAAAEPQEKARETKENQHGTFTSFLLEGLKSSMLDTNKDSQISIIELGQYAVDKTIEHEAKKQNENERQTPIMRNFGEDRAMYK